MKTALLLIVILLPLRAIAADSITITIPQPLEHTVIVDPAAHDWPFRFDTQELQLTQPVDGFDNPTEELKGLEFIAGADSALTQQMRIGSDPAPFTGGYWPIAELRTDRSPKGRVLATYTTTVEDVAQVIWSHRLTSLQTAALSGVTGITELSFPDGAGHYLVWYHIPTKVRPSVTHLN